MSYLAQRGMAPFGISSTNSFSSSIQTHNTGGGDSSSTMNTMLSVLICLVILSCSYYIISGNSSVSYLSCCCSCFIMSLFLYTMMSASKTTKHVEKEM